MNDCIFELTSINVMYTCLHNNNGLPFKVFNSKRFPYMDPACIGWESPKELERVKHVLQGPSMYVYMRPVLLSLSHLMYA